jgi:hypothetical protein
MNTDHPRDERERIVLHLREAERLARTRELSRLDPLRRLVRALLLGELAHYRKRELFPQNPDFQQPTPFFVDAAQTRCAVAHLLEMGGEPGLVQHIARERNHARVAELSNESRLRAWLDAAGLTLQEAAAIQPTYRFSRAECVCGGAFGSPGLLGGKPADGVLVGTVVDTNSNGALMRVDMIYGDAEDYAVDQELRVEPAFSEDAELSSTLVVPVHSPGAKADDQDAGARRLIGAVLAPDGTYSCLTEDWKLGPLRQSELIAALRADDCKAKLTSFDARWGEMRGGDDPTARCSVTPGLESSAAPTTIGILLSLTAAIAARHARRTRRVLLPAAPPPGQCAPPKES